MAVSSRKAVAVRLAAIGLRRTLLAVKQERGYTVARLRASDKGISLAPLGVFDSDHVSVIGRVGIPEAQLGTNWADTMPFYGKWFDDIGGTDVGYHLRRNISALSTRRLLEQIARDDQYALIGHYDQVFVTIMATKQRVPLVLIDDTHLLLSSFPVVLPELADKEFEERLMSILRIMLKSHGPGDVKSELKIADVGIEVEELPDGHAEP